MSKNAYLLAYLKPLAKYLEDDRVIEIAINPDGNVWVEYQGAHSMEKQVDVDNIDTRNLTSQIAGRSGLTIGHDAPLVSTKFDYHGKMVRTQVVAPPAADGGYSITLRCPVINNTKDLKVEFLYGKQTSLEEIRKRKLADIKKLADSGDINATLKACVENRLNVLLSGGTSTGKTTIARHMIEMISHDERLVTIEDAIEINPTQPNSVRLVCDREPDSPRDATKLLQACLRMRPDRIIVGELRGSEALTFLEAINTGHGGSMSTIHAETAKLAIKRLAHLVLHTGIRMDSKQIIEDIKDSIDVIVQLGRENGKRGIAQLYFPKLENNNSYDKAFEYPDDQDVIHF